MLQRLRLSEAEVEKFRFWIFLLVVNRFSKWFLSTCSEFRNIGEHNTKKRFLLYCTPCIYVHIMEITEWTVCKTITGYEIELNGFAFQDDRFPKKILDPIWSPIRTKEKRQVLRYNTNGTRDKKETDLNIAVVGWKKMDCGIFERV